MKSGVNRPREMVIALLPAFALTLASFLLIYGRAIVTISPNASLRLLLFLWLLLLILIWPLHQFTQDWHMTGLLLTIFVSGFYLIAALFYSIIGAGFLGIIVIALINRIRKTKFTTSQITILSYVIISIMLILIVSQLFVLFRSVNWRAYQNGISRNKNSLPTLTVVQKTKPDIYYIILDAYGRSDILQEYYQYNNTEFTDKLKDRGFFVPKNSHSNYPLTALSVSSSLNMDYIQNISSGIDQSNFWWLMKPYLEESRVQLLLKSAGYNTFSISTDWDITNNTTADFYFSPQKYQANEFEKYFLDVTPLKVLKPVLGNTTDGFGLHRELAAYNFTALSEISKIRGPKFVFAHIIAPHPPFVFDKYGNPVNPSYNFTFADGIDYPGTKDEYRAGYIEQVQYLNAMLIETMDKILSQSEHPPIIILQADHGPRMMVDYRYPESICPKERFSIFAAYYLPGLSHNPIPEDITPVNLFRVIFNEYFDTQLDLIDNDSYIPLDKIYIYNTEKVTSKLMDACISAP